MMRNLRIEILNVHHPSSPVVLGVAQTTVGSIMGARRQTSSYPLFINGSPVPGQIITQAEKADEFIPTENGMVVVLGSEKLTRIAYRVDIVRGSVTPRADRFGLGRFGGFRTRGVLASSQARASRGQKPPSRFTRADCPYLVRH